MRWIETWIETGKGRCWGVYGRKAGSVAGFTYSDALRRISVIWDQASLEKWLMNPEAMAPGNDMDFHVEDVGERTQIVRYL
jgi:cytochrome c